MSTGERWGNVCAGNLFFLRKEVNSMSETELQAQLAALRLELAQANRRAEEERAAKEEERAAKEEANRRAEEERAAKECTSVHFTYFSVLIRFS